MKTLAGAAKYSFAIISLLWCSCTVTKPQATQFDAVHYDAAYIKIDSTISKDQKMESFLAPYRKAVDSAMDIVIGYSDMPFTKAQPECTLGDFITDAQLQYAQRTNPDVKISVLNYGSIRLPYLAPGGISKGQVFEIMPFDNMLTIVEVPGKVLKQFCNHIAAWGGWPVSGISFKIKGREAQDMLVNGAPINDQLIYNIAMPDYVANGGDDCDFLMDCKKQYLKVFTRDILIDYISALQSKNEKLHINIEKRISYAE
jgi:2',3'-cyclic-nucleotide 2'-phosphodiesterase (5'-nucleotidase family)